MTQRKFALPLLAGLALAACQQPANDANIAIDNGVNATEAADADIETLPPSETSLAPASGNGAAAPLNEADDGGSEDPDQAFFPAQYRGRWGMVPADCTSTRGDAKGLITIGDTTVKFYESLANLKEQRPASATSFSGLFAFTGEGQKWQKVMTFTRTGDTLKRADDEGSFTYSRC
jgi:hypothetical protein